MWFLLFSIEKRNFFSAIRYYFIGGIGFSLLFPLFTFTKIVYVEQAIDWSLILNQANQEAIENTAYGWLSHMDTTTMLLIGLGLIACFSVGYAIFKVIGLVRYIKKLHLFSTTIDHIKIDTKTNEAYSFWKWIVLPVNYKEIARLDTIIQHENIHLQDKHTLDLVLIHFLRRLFWFNPLLIFLEKAIRLNLEYIVDQKVSEQSDSYTYQLTLVQFEQLKSTEVALVNSFGSSDLKKRIMMLNQPKSTYMKKTKFALCLPLAVGFFFLFQVKTKAEVRLVDQEVTHDQEEQEPQKTGIISASAEKRIDELHETKEKEQSTFTYQFDNTNNQGEQGNVVIALSDEPGAVKIMLNGEEVSREEFQKMEMKRMTEGKTQTFSFDFPEDSNAKITVNGKEYAAAAFSKLKTEEKEDSSTSREALKEEMKRAREDAKAAREETKRSMEDSKAAREDAKRNMEESRLVREEAKHKRDKAKKESGLAQRDYEAVKDKLIIYNGKEYTFDELVALNPSALGGGSIKVYNNQQGKELLEKKDSMVY